MSKQDPGKRRTPPSGKDGAGVGRGQRWLGAALVLACIGGIGYYALNAPLPRGAVTDAREQASRAGAGTPADAGGDATTMARQPLTPHPAGSRRDPNDLASHVDPRQPAPTMGEVIERLHQAGIRTGLGAFNPPGTSPPLVGLAVPDDYVLPEGYVRHHQATDDGQPIEPILMYSPDYEFLDAAGQPVAVPADRVVPAAHAPPGLPIRRVRIPPPRDPGSTP